MWIISALFLNVVLWYREGEELCRDDRRGGKRSLIICCPLEVE